MLSVGRHCRSGLKAQAGVTMLEVLITLVIIAFGLLGLAGLHLKIQTMELEAYQRAQAILLLGDMTERLRTNSANASWYVPSYVPASPAVPDPPPTTHPYGTVNPATDTIQDCTDAATFNTQAKVDICQWSNMLKGAKESSSGNRVGAMIGARGCIEEIQAPDPTPGICRPGVYRVTVTWQGMSATSVPALSCGAGAFGSNDAMRRAISSTMAVGLPRCV